MRHVVYFLALMIAVATIHGCGPAQSTVQPKAKDRKDLLQQFRKLGKVTIFYGKGPLKDEYKQQAEILKERLSEMYKVRIDAAPDQLNQPPEGLVYLIGSPVSNPLIKEVSSRLSMTLATKNMKIGNDLLVEADVAFFTLLQDPQQQQTIYNLLISPDDAAVLSWAKTYFNRSPLSTDWDYQLYRHDQLFRYGMIGEPDYQPTLQDISQLRRALGSRMVVYGTGDEEAAPIYKAIVERLTQRRYRRNFKIVADTAVTLEELKRHQATFLGTPKSNKWIGLWQDKLPFTIGKNSLTINETSFSGTDDLIYVSGLPSPANPYLAINIISAAYEQSLQSLPDRPINISLGNWGSMWNYQVYRGNGRIAMGKLEMKEGKLAMAENRFNTLLENADTIVTKNARVINFNDTLSSDAVKEIATKFDQRQQKISAFLERPNTNDSITYYLFGSVEEKALMSNNSDLAHVHFDENVVCAIVNNQFPNSDIGRENQLLLRTLLGNPKHQLLETGLAVYFTDNWQRKGYQHWAKKLIQADFHLSLYNLLNAEIFNAESELVKECLAGSFVAFLIEKHWGKSKFLAQYQNWSPDDTETDRLKVAWKQYVKSQGPEINHVRRTAMAGKLQKGFNLTHEGYQIVNGYTGNAVKNTIAHLQSMNTNAIALVPYSFMPKHNEPNFLWFNRNPGGENDQGVVHTAYLARSAGMSTLLKPHVWLGDAWPGAVNMENDQDWELFFNYYSRWIRHYALLAEIHGFDSFSVGVEFAKATLGHEEEWRTLIRKVKQVFSGPVTYCANWGEEFEGITFWDELDYIGIDCYYPLSKSESATFEDLQEGADDMLDKIGDIAKRYQKQVLITEIGFRSVENPWIAPYEESNGKAVNAAHQNMAYQAVLSQLKDRPWLSGIYFWKWPVVQQEISVSTDRRFIPQSKPAEKTIKAYFKATE